MNTWRCISGCGACCRLDPALRGEALEALSPEQRELYLSMVGPDGWCVHFDTGGRRCRIYSERPDFCRVENLVRLFGAEDADADALAIACCTQQIRSESGGRGRVMRRFRRAIRGAASEQPAAAAGAATGSPPGANDRPITHDGTTPPAPARTAVARTASAPTAAVRHE